MFGKNGSGKSTIAQGLKLISGNEKLMEYDTLEYIKVVFTINYNCCRVTQNSRISIYAMCKVRITAYKHYWGQK